MILEEGTHKFKCDAPSFDWACVSAAEPSTVEVLRGGVREDLVYVNHTTHTWWSNNSLFSPTLRDGEEITIIVTGKAAMRVECVGLKRI